MVSVSAVTATPALKVAATPTEVLPNASVPAPLMVPTLVSVKVPPLMVPFGQRI